MFPQPELQAPSQPQPTFAAPTPVVENLMYKNDLHCYCQKLGIPLPVYQTAVEGCTQSIRCRSTVLVDTKRFTSANTFLKRKSAEQDAAKVALQHLMNENEARSTNLGLYLRNLVCQDKARCKMILHEFAVKIKAEYAYNTFYNGEAGKNMKEAEQLAALAAILSLLDDLTYSATISEIIKSKVKNFQNTRNCSATNEDHKTTSLTNDGQMHLSQQIHFRALADEIIPRSIKLQGNNDEQGGSKKLTDEHCSHGMVDEKPQELVNLQAKRANCCNFGPLDDKQQEMDNLQAKIANLSIFGVLDDKKDSACFPIEAVTISRSSYVALPIISPTFSESQHGV